PLAPAEVGQVDDEAGGNDLGAHLAQELRGAFGGTAGGNQIVDQDHPVAGADTVAMHLHLVDATFEAVGDAYRLVRQLALLADGNETGGELMCDGAAENEAARLDAGDPVDLAAGIGMHQLVDRAP